MKRRPTRHAHGFTLIEIMVVVIVIGILAALIVPSFFGRAGKARAAVAKQQIGTLETAINLFEQDYGRFPQTLEELTTRPSDVDDDQWTPPSIKSGDLTDPWGNAFVYRYPGQNWAFDLMSLGADGQEGGADENADIVNW
ncbi:MAG: type II secretion system major pseudopilin GspG [Planctomycetota bacterium]